MTEILSLLKINNIKNNILK